MLKQNVQETVDEKPTTSETNWAAFAKALLAPKSVECNGYHLFHNPDLGCHTRIRPNPVNLKAHADNGHGGGFIFTLRPSDRPWHGWAKFTELGLESVDFRCYICDKQLPFNAQKILPHMKP